MYKSKKIFYEWEARKMNMTVKELKYLIKRLNLEVVPCYCNGSYQNCTGYELQKKYNLKKYDSMYRRPRGKAN